MARITLDLDQRDHRPPMLVRSALGYARRQYGQDMDSGLAMSHHPGVFWPWVLMEMANQRRRSQLPEHVAELVTLSTAMHLGCSWCIDFGASLWEQQGFDVEVIKDLTDWRAADRFDDDTRRALEFAEAASGDLDQVTDELVADLRARFGESGLVELAYVVALENMRSRFNSSLGLSSQGFSSGEACSLAARQRVVGRA